MSLIDNIKNGYNAVLDELRKENADLRKTYKKVSSSSYSGGIPDVSYNRGDKSDLFAFPYKFAQTCKELANSSYLETIIPFYVQVFNTFKYKIVAPKRDYKYNAQIQSFLEEQFDNAGGINRFITTIAKQALLYGFTYFTSNTTAVQGKNFGFDNRVYCIDSFKYYDVAFTRSFIFDDNDYDLLRAVNVFSCNKTIYDGKSNDDLLNDLLGGLEIEGKELTIDFEKGLGGYITHGNNTGDVVGTPFLYTLYNSNKILESMDNSFIKSLENFGEHSFNFVPIRELTDQEREEVCDDIKHFLKQKGGVFLSKYGKLEKIEAIDSGEWASFRDTLQSAIYKNKNLDIKALGLTRGATKNLAQFNQSDAVLQASNMMSDFLYQLNNNFMKYYFDVNFKYLRLNGEANYFKIEVEVDEALPTEETNAETKPTISLSGIRDDSKKNETTHTTADNGAEETTKFDVDGNVEKRTTTIPVQDKRFVKNVQASPVSLVVDATTLDTTLRGMSDELNNFLLDILKKNIRNKDFIKNTILNNKKSLIMGFDNKDEVEKGIYDILYKWIRDMVKVKADESIAGFGANGLEKFKNFTNIEYNKFIDKETEKYVKKYGNKIAKDLVSKTEALMRTDIRFYIENTDPDDPLDDRVIDAQNQLVEYKGAEVVKITDRETLNTFQDVSDTVVEDISKKQDVAIIRVGILDNMCDVCKEKMGRVFFKDDNDDWYNPDYPYEALPDRNCLGGQHRCNCYYTVMDRTYYDNVNHINSKR